MSLRSVCSNMRTRTNPVHSATMIWVNSLSLVCGSLSGGSRLLSRNGTDCLLKLFQPLKARARISVCSFRQIILKTWPTLWPVSEAYRKGLRKAKKGCRKSDKTLTTDCIDWPVTGLALCGNIAAVGSKRASGRAICMNLWVRNCRGYKIGFISSFFLVWFEFFTKAYKVTFLSPNHASWTTQVANKLTVKL